LVEKSKIGIFGIFTGRNGRPNMHRKEADTLTLGDAMRYFNDGELNPREELLQDFKLLLKVHREHINGLSDSEYREYRRKRDV
jgi:hypothetical protein